MSKLYYYNNHPKVWSKLKMKRLTVQNLELSFITECGGEEVESFAKDVLSKAAKILKANGLDLVAGTSKCFCLKIDLVK